VAQKYAIDIMNTANSGLSGFITNSRLELYPEETSGLSEEAYKNKVTSAYLTVTVNSVQWNGMDDGSKEDITASFVTSVGNIFSHGYPHITVNNNVRTVATGEYNLTKTEPKVTLK
jgi:hypothetical protein